MSRLHKKLSFKQLLKRIFFIFVGAAMVAIGLKLFMVPNHVIDGGIVGISIMLSYITNWGLGLFLFFLNLPFFAFGYKQIGKTFALSTLCGIVILSLGVFYLDHLLVMNRIAPATTVPMLAAVFGGMIVGIGTGIVIRYGGSLDGTEIMAISLSKRLPFSVGQIVMFFNLFILGSAGFIFNNWDRVMYSFIAFFIAFKMIDVAIEGFDETKSVWIISDYHIQIGEALLNRLGRGVTYLDGTGAYTGENKKVIFCVITRLEEAKLKSIIDEIDSEAFLAIGHMHDVRGGRFKKREIH